MSPKREQNCPNWGARGEGRLFGKDPNVNILLLLTSSLTHSRSTLTCTLSYFWYKRGFLSGWVSVKQLKGWTKSPLLLLLSLEAQCKLFLIFFYRFPRLTRMFQAFCGGSEEAQVFFGQHKSDNLNPSDCFHLLRVLKNPYHLWWEEKESHLLGWDATRRSSSVFNSQQGSWRRICAATGVELEWEWKEGRKVPPLLDHHHLHLDLHLLHHHNKNICRHLHSSRKYWLGHLLILNKVDYVIFICLVWLIYILKSLAHIAFPSYIFLVQCWTSKHR